MAQSDETRLALLEEQTKNIKGDVSKLVEKIEQLTQATQTLNETLIRNESIKDDIRSLNTRVARIEIIADTVPLNNFKTESVWGFLKGNITTIINFLLVAALSAVVIINR